MIEIFILIGLCKNIGARARRRGRKAVGYQFMLLGFWFGGEILGMVISLVALMILMGRAAEDYFLLCYVGALAGAALGAFIAFQIVTTLPVKSVDATAALGVEDSTQPASHSHGEGDQSSTQKS